MRDGVIIPYVARARIGHENEDHMPALQRPHVLIVSDDRDLTDFLGEGLVYAGFWTSVIASAVQAMEVLRLRTFDLMIVDAELGGIGAIEFVRRLRGLSDRADATGRTDIPILAIASALETVSAPLIAAGADVVMTPPIELDDLASQLTDSVQQWRTTHPGRLWADQAAQS
jgi:CheY-like chemotaxis protein